MKTPANTVNSDSPNLGIIDDPIAVPAETQVTEIIQQLNPVGSVSREIVNPGNHCGFQQKCSSCALVVENDQAIGIITQGDIVRLWVEQQQSWDRLLARDVMAQPMVTLQESAFHDAATAMALLQQHRIQHLPLVDCQGKLAGLATEASLRKTSPLLDLLQRRKVENAMDSKPATVAAHTSLSAIAQQMTQQKLDFVVIVESDRPLGIVAKGDLVKCLAEGLDLEQHPAQAVIDSPLESVKPSDSLLRVQQLLARHQVDALAVTGEQGELIGVVAENSFVETLNPVELYQLADGFQAKLDRQVAGQTAAFEAKAEREQLLRTVADQIRSSLDVQEILEQAVFKVRSLLNCDRVMIYQLHPNFTGQVIAESKVGVHSSLLNREVSDPCLSSELLEPYRQGKAGIINDVYEANLSPCHRQMLLDIDIRAKLMAPIVIDEQLWGWIIASHADRPYVWQDDEIELLEQLSVYIAIALKQGLAYQQLQTELEQRRQTEAHLKFSENRFRAIFDNTFQLIGLLSPDGIVLEANQTALNVAGLQREDVVGRPFWETYWWQISATAQAQLQEAVDRAAQGEFVRYEADIWGSNQRVMTIDFSLRPIQDDAGNVILLIPEGRDLTEAKRLENERQQNLLLLEGLKRRYASLVEASPVGIFRSDLAGNCIYASDVCRNILGLSHPSIKGQGWQQALHPDDREQVIAAWHQALQAYRPFQMEYRFQQPDGTVRWVYAQSVPEPDRKGRITSYMGTVTDISDRVAAETALQNIIAGTAAATGNNFFPALVKHVAQSLNVSYVLVSYLEGEALQTLAFCDNGKPQSNFSYPWRQTPCEQSLQQGVFYCEEFVQEQFPGDPALGTLGATSYLGVALFDSGGNVIGNLCIMDRQRLPYPERLAKILHVFAARAAAELERQRANTQLEQLNRNLETKVEQRTIALQKRKAQLQDFLDNANDLIQSVFLETGAFEYVNRAWREVLGYSAAEVEQLTVFDLLHRTCRQHWQDLMAAMRGGHLSTFENLEVTLFNKDNQEVIVEGSLNCRFEGKQAIAVRAIFRDITQRKQTEEKNRLLQERLQYLLNANPAIIYSCHPESRRIAFISENVTTILGYRPKDIAEQPNFWADRIHSDDQSRVLAELSSCLWQEETHKQEYRFLHREGHYIWIRDEQCLVRDEQGKPLEIVGYWADISEQKQAAQAIKESQAFLETVLNTLPLYVFWKNRNSVYLGCNENTANVAGLSHPKAIIGKTDYDLPWADTNAESYIADDQEVIQSGIGKLGIIETLFKNNGEQVWIEASKVPLRNADGEIIGILGNAQDITARKQAEAQLQQTNQELIRATRLKDEFVATMSHELRTPLNAILGMAEALQEQVLGSINQKQDQALKTIENRGLHLLELINDILDFSQIESGKMQLEPTETNVAALCDAALASIKPQADKKGIRLETKLLPHLPQIAIDERRIRQVLINLLTNAVKFTREGGRIALEGTIVQHNPHLKATPFPYSLRIAVIDTGIGIAPENFHKLFEPFTQIDSALNRKYQGTGLGLALVKRIVESHGGTVEVESEPEVGSCFAVDLPYKKAIAFSSAPISQSEATSEANAPAAEVSPLLLLAEDQNGNMTTIFNYLEAKGYCPALAKSREEALQIARSKPPEAIVMDVQIDGTYQMELIQQIRSDANLKDVPIVALTALDTAPERDRWLQAGANAYLSKPIKMKELAALIQQLASPG